MDNKKAMISFPSLKIKVSDNNKTENHTFVNSKPNNFEIKNKVEQLSKEMNKKNIAIAIGF